MLSDTLTKIELDLKQSALIEDSYIPKVIEFLSQYKIGYWLYPGVIKRKLDMSVQNIYNFLNYLEGKGYVEGYYELYCSQCQKSSGIVVRTFNQLPEVFTCEVCNNELPALENAVLIYKVIVE